MKSEQDPHFRDEMLSFCQSQGKWSGAKPLRVPTKCSLQFSTGIRRLIFPLEIRRVHILVIKTGDDFARSCSHLSVRRGSVRNEETISWEDIPIQNIKTFQDWEQFSRRSPACSGITADDEEIPWKEGRAKIAESILQGAQIKVNIVAHSLSQKDATIVFHLSYILLQVFDEC